MFNQIHTYMKKSENKSIAFINTKCNVEHLRAGRVVGSANGYVVVGKGHPLYGKTCDEIEEMGVHVHGGITYADGFSKISCEWLKHCNENGDKMPILKNAFAEKDCPNAWVIGFDTCHFGDTPETWPIDAVREETMYLQEQIDRFAC